jgi:hypothetical protein
MSATARIVETLVIPTMANTSVSVVHRVGLGFGGLGVEGWELETGNRQRDTGNGTPATGNRRLTAGNGSGAAAKLRREE